MTTTKDAAHFPRGWLVASLRSPDNRLPLAVLHLPRLVAIGAIYLYRWTIGVLWGGRCKYHPTCSQYALDVLRHYGLVRGSILAGWRLLRCNPWSRGGVDYAENQRLFR
jgi:putative membrane protein insertion efficiency factor